MRSCLCEVNAFQSPWLSFCTISVCAFDCHSLTHGTYLVDAWQCASCPFRDNLGPLSLCKVDFALD
jgi:hypothetical protein